MDPEAVALLVRDDQRPFALIGQWAGGGAIIGSEPVAIARPDDDPFALLDEQPHVVADSGPDDQPRVVAHDRPDDQPHLVADPIKTNVQFNGVVGGGWFGYLGYELGARVEPVGPPPPTGARLPAFDLAFYDHVLRQDAEGRWWFEALWTEARADALDARLSEFRHRARGGAVKRPRPFTTAPWRATPARAGHELAVAACRRRIHEGDLFQANICARLDSTFDGDPIDLFAKAVAQLCPDRAAFFSGPWGAVASLSPELFLARHDDTVRSAPIKGTRSRPANPDAAAQTRDELARSEKDRAENVMIVDLVRNDLGRVGIPGSIHVAARDEIRPHTGVWHLVSEVAGRLPAGTGNAELVRAAFPPGSVTGAPKVAALNVIAELESTARNVYTGAIGFASPVAGLELSVAIRTFEFQDDDVWLGVGGGIVADSDPAAEAAECMVKAAPLLRAIGGRLADASDGAAHGAARIASAPVRPGPAAVPGPVRHGPRPIPRPDPRAGVFETLMVATGESLHLEQHLARLGQSVRALYGQNLPATLQDELVTTAAEAQTDPARMRVNARPTDAGLSIDVELGPVPIRNPPTQLEPVTVPGGIGPHKWIDRRLLAALASHAGGNVEPLLCDLDGFVLETARANLFMVTPDHVLVTPPADGRILPGVSRARVLQRAANLGLRTLVRPVRLSELSQASELFLTGSLAGVEPAFLGTGEAGPGHPTQVSEQLRTNLYKTPRQVILR
ncbi:MAG: aminodeoxychorismate synthase component I [Solirubrobacteraceae bacterium]